MKIARRIATTTLAAALLCSMPFAEARTQTIEATGVYQMGENDTIATAKENAKKAALRAAAERAGVFVRSYSKTKNLKLTDDQVEVISMQTMQVKNCTFMQDYTNNTLVIHAVNYSNTNRNLLLSLKGFDEVKEVKAISLSGVQNGRNTPENPTQFVPVEEQLAPGNRLPLKPYSYTVFVLTTKGADGIAKVTAQEADTTLVYDISGRKASRDATGLLIMNNRVVRVR